MHRYAPSVEWAGIRGIDLPLRLAGADTVYMVQASVDLHVCLNAAAVAGIQAHWLYALAMRLAESPAMGLADLSTLLRDAVSHHLRGGATAARLVMRLRLLAYHPTFIAPDCGGWKPYPVVMVALWDAGAFHVDVQMTAAYPAESRLPVRPSASGRAPARECVVEVHVRLAGDDMLAVGQLAQRIETAMAAVHAAVARRGRAVVINWSEDESAQYVRGILSQYYAGTRVTIRSLASLDGLQGRPHRSG